MPYFVHHAYIDREAFFQSRNQNGNEEGHDNKGGRKGEHPDIVTTSHWPPVTTGPRILVGGFLNDGTLNTHFHPVPTLAGFVSSVPLSFPLGTLRWGYDDGRGMVPIVGAFGAATEGLRYTTSISGGSRYAPLSPSPPPFSFDVPATLLLNTSFITSFEAPHLPYVPLTNGSNHVLDVPSRSVCIRQAGFVLGRRRGRSVARPVFRLLLASRVNGGGSHTLESRRCLEIKNP